MLWVLRIVPGVGGIFWWGLCYILRIIQHGCEDVIWLKVFLNLWIVSCSGYRKGWES